MSRNVNPQIQSLVTFQMRIITIYLKIILKHAYGSNLDYPLNVNIFFFGINFD